MFVLGVSPGEPGGRGQRAADQPCLLGSSAGTGRDVAVSLQGVTSGLISNARGAAQGWRRLHFQLFVLFKQQDLPSSEPVCAGTHSRPS